MMKAVFLVHNHWGSAVMRGHDAARIVGGAVAPCNASVASLPADVFVHVKFACAHARPAPGFHVLDRIDNTDTVDLSWFDAEITSNEAQLRQCRTRVCATIPHHANLDCRMHAGLARRRPIVGLVGSSTPASHTLLKELRAYAVVSEMKVSGCKFYDQIDIAIAWKKHERNRPGTRFAMPLWFGIPTIGHAHHTSYAEYEHAHPFLCSSDACALAKVHGIVNGTLGPAFRKLREEVRADVNSSVAARRYLALFERLRHRDGRRMIAGIV